MQTVVEQWLKIELSPEEEVKRLADLEVALKNYGFNGDYLFVLKAYEDYKRASIYPFVGGRGEQPQWILDDFDTLALLEERMLLRKKIGKSPTGIATDSNAPPAPLPKFKF